MIQTPCTVASKIDLNTAKGRPGASNGRVLAKRMTGAAALGISKENREMKVVLAAAAIAGLALLGARGAQANTITETYTFPSPLVGYTDEGGSSFSEFNPVLGTLNSITLNDTATARFSGGGAGDFNTARYDIFLNINEFSMFAAALGNSDGSASISDYTVTNPSILSNFIGAGKITTRIDVSNASITGANISSDFGTETLAYNYTPSASVPEPASLALLGAALVGLGLICRRRSAASPLS